jgi:hypothetical protein
MSRLKEFHDLEDALKVEMARLELLKNEEELIAELAFEKKLMSLMKRYDRSTDDVLAILNCHTPASSMAVHETKADYTVTRKTSTKKPAAKR